MAKRMTLSEIWDKEWFMELTPTRKCLVRYIWDNCNVAGVWSPNWRLASFKIGDNVSLDDIKEIDNGNRHEILENGKIWIIDFIDFQCGPELKPNSPFHKKVISLLKEDGLFNRVSNRVSNTLQEKEEYILKEKEEEKRKEIRENNSTKLNKECMFVISEFTRITGRLIKKPEIYINTVKSRIKDYSSESLIKIIMMKNHEWAKDPLMKKHLTLTTLMRPKNCLKYYEQLGQIEQDPTILNNDTKNGLKSKSYYNDVLKHMKNNS